VFAPRAHNLILNTRPRGPPGGAQKGRRII